MSKFENPQALTGVPLEVQPADRTADKHSAESDEASAGKPSPNRTRLLIAAGVCLAVLAIYKIASYVMVGQYRYSTDDAYIRADVSIIAAKVSGYVASVAVKDNQRVKAGDQLLQIDDGDYRLAVDAARGKLETQIATIERLQQQVEAQKAVINQALAQVNSANADKVRTSVDLERSIKLAQSQYASVKTLDQARADNTKAIASMVSAEAAVEAAKSNLAVAVAQKVEAERLRDELDTALAKVRRDLSFATVRAPIDGIVGNRAAQMGDYVQTGTRLLALVPLETAYVEANFKETQLKRIRPGQSAIISVDAASGKVLQGTVESVSPASGSQYSLLPPENATGNFTKIVQRVPVRIKIPAAALSDGIMKPGLSVVVEVDTKTMPSAQGAPQRQSGATP